MSKFRKVSTSMWGDRKFRELSKPQPNGQSLWQWLITGPRTTQIPGVIIGRLDVLAAEIGWPLKGFREAFAEASGKGMAKVDDEVGFVFLPRALKHNKPESPNVVRSWRAVWDDVPECALKSEAWQVLKTLCEGFGGGFAKAFGEACAQPSPNQEQEQEQEQEQDKNIAAPTVLELVREAPPWSPDLESLYRAYPLKKGKSKGMAKAKAQVRTPEDFEALRKAIANYSAERAGKDPQYTKHFSTFMAEWREHVEPSEPTAAWSPSEEATMRQVEQLRRLL